MIMSKTHQWSISLTAYSSGAWSVGVHRSDYADGVLIATELEYLRHVEASELFKVVGDATGHAYSRAWHDRLIAAEGARLSSDAPSAAD